MSNDGYLCVRHVILTSHLLPQQHSDVDLLTSIRFKPLSLMAAAKAYCWETAMVLMVPVLFGPMSDVKSSMCLCW